jgi:hypothetical protein
MMVASAFELAFFPVVFFALGLGFWLGVRVAMRDEKQTLYWRRRAKAAEGQLRSMKRYLRP